MSKIAAIQMCSTHVLDENLAIANVLIQEAAAQDAALVVLPENFALMSLERIDSLNQKEQFGEGKIQNFLAEIAKENNVWIVGGTIPIASELHPNKICAACLTYDNYGKLAGRYDKSNLFDAVISENEIYKESDFIDPGDTMLVINTPLGKLGAAVCFDLRFPPLFKELSKQGVEIIAVPAAFTMKTGEAHWEILTRCRAIDTFSYIIGAAQGGVHTNERKTYGHSIIIDPWGAILAEKKDQLPGIILADTDMDYVHKIRQSIPNTSR